MKHIYIIRHGETDFNKSHLMQGRGIDASINETGKEQSESIADFFIEIEVERIISSSMKRAIESANSLSDKKGLITERYSELDEMNFGDLEGKPFEEVKEELNYLHESWSNGLLDIPTPNGETPIQVFERANSKAIEILENACESVLVFVLHGRLIRILLSEWLGLGLKNMHKIKHQNGAINHLKWDESKFEAIDLNIISHLEAIKVD